MRTRSVVVVSHKYLTQPDDELVAYLNTRTAERVLHICHSFSDAPDRCSRYRLYTSGRLAAHGAGRDYAAWPEPVIYAKEMVLTLIWTLRFGLRWDLYIGMDGLCVLFGNILRTLGRVVSTVYWAIDYVPENRFKSAVKNRIYRWVNLAGYRRADQVWDLGPRMAQAREEHDGLKTSDYRKLRVVPYGMWLDRVPHLPYERCERNTVVFMGHLLEKQGVQLALHALPRLRERVPGARLKIVGDGAYRANLERLATDLGITAHCDFLGRIADIEELEREVAHACVAVAPYLRALDSWTRYADPGKIKTYLACGVPVVLTDLPWNARDIEQNDCGAVVAEDPGQIADALTRLMEPAINARMRERARAYAARFEWSEIFPQVLPI